MYGIRLFGCFRPTDIPFDRRKKKPPEIASEGLSDVAAVECAQRSVSIQRVIAPRLAFPSLWVNF